MGFLPDGAFTVTKSFGVHQNWARKWRIRMYSHRSSFVGEGHAAASGHVRQTFGLPSPLQRNAALAPQRSP
eukprot:1014848-Pyramimonas_sp.AAC.1